MKAGLSIMLAVTVLFSIVSAASDAEEKDGWQFENHADSTISNYVGSCYHKQYTYYKSFKCETLEKNCVKQASYCGKLDDPLDNYENKTGYYLAIILPSVFGGLLLSVCAAPAAWATS